MYFNAHTILHSHNSNNSNTFENIHKNEGFDHSVASPFEKKDQYYCDFDEHLTFLCTL